MRKLRQDKLPWIERLDMVNAPAPIAPELAYAEDQVHIIPTGHCLTIELSFGWSDFVVL